MTHESTMPAPTGRRIRFDDDTALVIARLLSGFVILVSLGSLVAWAAGRPDLTRLHPDWTAIRPWAIVLLLLLATATLLQAYGHWSLPRVLLARVLAGAAGLVSGYFLIGWGLGRTMPLESLLFPDALATLIPPTSSAPAPYALLIALALSVFVGLRWVEAAWAALVSNLSISFGVVVAVLSILGYLFGAVQLLGTTSARGIALGTAVCLLLIGLAAVESRPQRPPRTWYTGLAERPTADRLLVTLAGLTVVVFLVREIADAAGLRPTEAWVVAVGAGLVAMAVVSYRLIVRQRALLDEARRLAAELDDSRRTFRLVAENAGDIVLTTDPFGVITWISPSVTRVLGWRPDEVIGRDSGEFLHPEDTATARLAPRRSGSGPAGGAPDGTVVVRVRTRDGGYRWMLDRASLLESGDGTGPGTIASLQAIDDLVDTQRRLARGEDLLRLITSAQVGFLERRDPVELFEGLLESTLEVTGCEYGFIGEVLHRPSGAPYLKTWALTNIAWNDATRDLYEQQARTGLEFDNLDTLFGTTLRTGEPVLTNDPYGDSRAGGLPREHPPMHSYLGLPLHADGAFVGMLGLANHPGGFAQETIDFLQPLTTALGRLIAVRRAEMARQRDRKEIGRLSTVVRQMTAGVAITDPDGRVEWVNAAFTTLIGPTRRDVVGRPLTEALGVADLSDPLLSGEPWTQDLQVTGAEGRPLHIEVDVTPLRTDSGTWTGSVVILTDVTERHAVSRMKDEFVSTISHELRTPLTSLSGAITLLAGTEADRLSPRGIRLLDMAEKNAARLRLLINDLLDLERLVAGGFAFDLETVRAGPLVDRAVHECHGYAEDHSVTFVASAAPDDAWIRVDPHRLGQVLANLLSNAAKFSPPGETVEITTTIDGDRVRLAVVDHGVGIPDEFRDRVFQKFAQADASTTRERGGSGLGLAIAKELVERMGGAIDFTSAPGVGTTFTIDLPRVSPPSGPAAEPATPAP